MSVCILLHVVDRKSTNCSLSCSGESRPSKTASRPGRSALIGNTVALVSLLLGSS